MEHKINKIKNFWDWFSKNSTNFGSNFENAKLLTELDVWISKLGNFSWELGPGKVKDYELVISPNGDMESLKYTKEIIANAQECIGWEFYYAKPPKEWNLMFDFKTTNGKEVKIDASKWKYVLLQYEDGLFDIIIKPEHLKQLSDEDELTAAEIVLDGILGEEKRMLKIDQIELVDEFEEANKDNASNMPDLFKHFLTLED